MDALRVTFSAVIDPAFRTIAVYVSVPPHGTVAGGASCENARSTPGAREVEEELEEPGGQLTVVRVSVWTDFS